MDDWSWNIVDLEILDFRQTSRFKPLVDLAGAYMAKLPLQVPAGSANCFIFVYQYDGIQLEKEEKQRLGTASH